MCSTAPLPCLELPVPTWHTPRPYGQLEHCCTRTPPPAVSPRPSGRADSNAEEFSESASPRGLMLAATEAPVFEPFSQGECPESADVPRLRSLDVASPGGLTPQSARDVGAADWSARPCNASPFGLMLPATVSARSEPTGSMMLAEPHADGGGAGPGRGSGLEATTTTTTTTAWCRDEPALMIEWPQYTRVLAYTRYLDVLDELGIVLEDVAMEVRHRFKVADGPLDIRELVAVLRAAVPAARAVAARGALNALQDELVEFVRTATATSLSADVT